MTTKTPGAEACELTVYFDGACPLCSAEIAHYEKQEGGERIAFVDVSDDQATLAPGLARDAAKRRFHVCAADGAVLSGAEAFVAIWATLPRWRWAARLARTPGVLPLLETAYRLFLPVRPLLSHLAGRLGARPRSLAP